MTTPPTATASPGEVKPLEPHERIELELFRRVLQDWPNEMGTDISDLIQTATDCISSGAFGKDDALRGLIQCLIYRVKTYRAECLAHRKENEQWAAKWKEAVMNVPDPATEHKEPECTCYEYHVGHQPGCYFHARDAAAPADGEGGGEDEAEAIAHQAATRIVDRKDPNWNRDDVVWAAGEGIRRGREREREKWKTTTGWEWGTIDGVMLACIERGKMSGVLSAVDELRARLAAAEAERVKAEHGRVEAIDALNRVMAERDRMKAAATEVIKELCGRAEGALSTAGVHNRKCAEVCGLVARGLINDFNNAINKWENATHAK